MKRIPLLTPLVPVAAFVVAGWVIVTAGCVLIGIGVYLLAHAWGYKKLKEEQRDRWWNGE